MTSDNLLSKYKKVLETRAGLSNFAALDKTLIARGSTFS